MYFCCWWGCGRFMAAGPPGAVLGAAAGFGLWSVLCDNSNIKCHNIIINNVGVASDPPPLIIPFLEP